MRRAAISRFRRFSCAVAVVTILSPAVLAPLSGLVLAIPTALVVAVAILPWPIGRVSLAQAAGAVGVLSLVLDLAYFGQRDLVLVWLTFEVGGLTILLGRVIREVPGRQVGVVAAVTGAAAVLAPLRFTLRASPPDWRASVVSIILVMFPLTLAVVVGLYLRALDNRRKRAVAEARREQRLELARELHDFVAHEVTGILLEVQAAQTREYDPVENRALLARLEEASQRALSSMDETLRTLRDPDGADGGSGSLRRDDLHELPALVGRFRESSTANVVLDFEEGLADLLPRRVQRTAFRIVLESLTNIRRHATKATEVRVTVRRVEGVAEETVEVSVANNGGRGGLLSADRRGGGTGLIDLNERVVALGGTLTAGPEGKGWCVRAHLPIAMA
ncbi:Signal transduction histidine kinase [Thermostaphylospora chromogena]|uniref:histidine kinase n=1 Tax=Thermostaphylospora chromogena TaxID=35622 RepID=A0A1H1HD50_9ACTN|nr:Signal transduction histidine kinase [Thermostaphylospora chromogena]